MRIIFWRSDKPREGLLAESFAAGARAHGDDVDIRFLTPDKSATDDCEVAVMVGVKSRELFWNYWNKGVHVVYLDKGYTRHAVDGPVKLWEYWRISLDSHNPTSFLCSGINMPSDRLEKSGLRLSPWRVSGSQVVFAGSSAKYHEFYGMHDPTRYAHKLVKSLREVTHRKIVYRPKPSWRDAVPIEGTKFSSSDQTIEKALKGAHVLVTHGSNACFEAVLLGVPCIVLGEAVAKSISSTSLADIEAPRLASEKERLQWLSNLMYCQWTMSEFSSGEAWSLTRKRLLHG